MWHQPGEKALFNFFGKQETGADKGKEKAGRPRSGKGQPYIGRENCALTGLPGSALDPEIVGLRTRGRKISHRA